MLRAAKGRSGFVAAVAVLLVASVCQAAPDDFAIEVDARQRVTMSGRGDSLRAAIAELCRRADVQLLAYDAADRPFAARYSSVPLSEALARLLRSEVYLAGVQTKPGTGSTEVTWLRVTGSDGSAVAPHFAADGEGAAGVAPELAAIDLGVSPRTIETALSSPDVGARAAARRSMVIALRENRAPLEQHLARDPTDLVATLAGYPHAVELAQSLEAVAKDANERTLLRGITHSLRVRHDAEARASAASEPSPR